MVKSYVFEGADFETSDWTLVGDAFWADDSALTPGKRLRLTSADPDKSGSAWLGIQEYNPQMDWTVSLRGQVTYRNDGSADGMNLIWQTDGTSVNAGDPDALSDALSGAYLALTLDSYQSGTDPHGNGLKVSTSSGLIGWLDLGDGLERNGFREGRH